MLTANQNHSDKLCLIIRTKPDDNDMKLCFEDHCIIGDCDGYVRWWGTYHGDKWGIINMSGDKWGIINMYGNAMKFATITCDDAGHLSRGQMA